MSASTPVTSEPAEEDTTPPAASLSDTIPNLAPAERIVLEYLRSRGFKTAEQSFISAVDGTSANDQDKEKASSSITNTVTSDELVKNTAIFSTKSTRPGENALSDSATVLSELASMGNPVNIQNLIASISSLGAEEVLQLDPTDKQEGFRELESWVDGSLDMYRPEFRPILFPIFCHFYLDLIQQGYKEAALRFYSEYTGSLAPVHNPTLHHLSTLLLPAHAEKDEMAQRFRNEKYTVRMSRSGVDLLVGWLTEGMGGEATGSGEGFSGEKGKRGRLAVMRVVNNHLRFDVTSSPSTTVSANAWEESTGLLSSLIPQSNALTSVTDVNTFNSSRGDLKLGPAPISEELQAETERQLREQAMIDRDPAAQYDAFARPAPISGVVSPTFSDLPPHPPAFRTIDVKREVEKVRDARKRIRLEPSALTNASNSAQIAAARARALPSICAYTLHDVGEGAPCITFSQDASLMAAGFAESYIRLWSLKGEKLKGFRNDFQSASIRDAASLRKAREKGGSLTRKLIGHSGPVYSVAFDPVAGSGASPRYLLSSSADATTRLWSLDTMTNVVAYQGHQNPVWDVQWSPIGIYFATASRDRTARLWSTDRTSALRVYSGHLSDVDCVRFHPNSLYLATASSDRTARLWDVQRGSCVRVFIGHQGAVSTLAFSPDGRYLASAGEDLAINLWDLGSGKRIKKMTGHTASIYSLAFSAESSLLVSGSADWTVRCWDVKGSGGLRSKSGGSGILAHGTGNEVVAEGSTGKEAESNNETMDLLNTFPTKRTPIINVQFTPRNLCLVAGPYINPEIR